MRKLCNADPPHVEESTGFLIGLKIKNDCAGEDQQQITALLSLHQSFLITRVNLSLSFIPCS
jgi:hypothetical protein